ncbi:MAG TPA: small ribosomal subunit Rsm22 family protein [Methanocella sp.]|nr:small ribosomal subunit Rsm22 family protein [Methanocella sp.]
MSDREVISAVKYVSRMKPEFLLSEIRDYVKGEVTVSQIHAIVGPVAFSLGIKIEPDEGDFRVSRLAPAGPMALDAEGRKAQEAFLGSPMLPNKLEKLIGGYIEKKTGKPRDDPAVLDKIRKAIVAQKAGYWKEGPGRKISYEKGYDILGYLAYQFPVYFVQTGHILYGMALDGLLKDRMKVLDVGTGPGTVPLALADFYRRTRAGEALVYSLERSDENIEAFMALVPAYAEGSGVTAERPVRADLLDMKAGELPEGLDLIVFSNVLNELGVETERRAEIVEALAGRLAGDGNILIVEPADKVNSMEMRKLVVRLMDKGLGVYSPCSFIWCARCHPESCWSFEAMEDIKPPRLMQKLAEEEPYRFLNTDIKYSYAILRKDDLSREKYRVPQKAKFARLSKLKARVNKQINVVAAVMSGDLGDKKDHVLKVCDGTSIKPVYAVLPYFHESPGNAALLKAKYGQVVEMYGVLVRYNKEYDAYNLLVTRNTEVKNAEVKT